MKVPLHVGALRIAGHLHGRALDEGPPRTREEMATFILMGGFGGGLSVWHTRAGWVGWSRPLPLIVGVAVLVVAACGQQVVGEAVAGDRVVRPSVSASTRSSLPRLRITSSSAASGSDTLTGLVGVWHGEYTCAQGNTGLTLSIGEPRGGLLPTIFDFFSLANNANPRREVIRWLGACRLAGNWYSSGSGGSTSRLGTSWSILP